MRPKKNDRVEKFCSRDCSSASKVGKPSWNIGQPMSAEAKAKLSKANQGRRASPTTEFKPEQMKGESNPRWSGGRYVTTLGYAMVLMPGHHRAIGRNRYVPEHTLVAERCLGRLLAPGETVHHINEVKDDNRPENLYLFPSQREHKRYHMDVRNGNREAITQSNLD